MSEKTLAPVRANAGVEAKYRKRLLRMVDAMAKSVLYWTRAAYRANEPAVLASDAAPADILRRALAELAKRWQKRFDDAAEDMADHFAQAAADRSDAALKTTLKKAGFTVELKLTTAQRDILKATVQANVQLIKSIPQRYLDQVQGAVMRSVQVGGDLSELTRELQKQHGVTRRRAAFIARDQNSKAVSAISHNRQAELGLTTAIWVHSGGGAHPRPSHLKAGRDRTQYDIRDGWLDPDLGRRIWPGSEPNCRCTSRPVIPGLDKRA